MISKLTEYVVKGQRFLVWSDYSTRCTYAETCSTFEQKVIRCNGYLSNENSIKRAIKISFNL